jgi:hypothetical protein
MLLPVNTSCIHGISLVHMLFDCHLQHQMRCRDNLWLEALQLCSNVVPLLCTWFFIRFLIAVCDCSLLLQATSAQNREQSATQEDRELSSQRAAADGQQAGDADGQVERQAPGSEGDEQQAGSSAAGAEVRAAWDAWQALQELLTVQRYWWKKLHFRYGKKGPLDREQQQTDHLCCKNSEAYFITCQPAAPAS